MSGPLRVSLLGVGAMGGSLLALLETGGVDGCTLASTIRSGSGLPDPAVLEDTDVLVEAAGAAAARTWVPLAVAAGIDVTPAGPRSAATR
jgi:aspartate dehydrogenase